MLRFEVCPEVSRCASHTFNNQGGLGCDRCDALNDLIDVLGGEARSLGEVGLGHSERV
jgi:hypothetical protein